MKTLFRNGLMLPFVMFVAACTGLPIQEATDHLKTKPVCCTSYSELKFEALALTEHREVSLDVSSPVMEFAEGRSYVAALSLPPNAHSLALQSIYPAYLPKTSYVDPVVVVLNTDKKEIARFAGLDLRNMYDTRAGFRVWYFGGQISLPSAASYLVIYANNRSQRILEAVSENGIRWPAPPAPIGTLGLTAQ